MGVVIRTEDDTDEALDEARRLGQVIADAFADLPQNLWLVPDGEERQRVFPAYFALQVEAGIRYGTVRTTPLRDAVAVWFPIDGTVAVLPDYDARLTKAVGPVWVDRFRAFENVLGRHHPVDEPHDYLAFLAVCPRLQSRGHGGWLLHEHHRVLDRDGTTGYLEAANPRSRDFYRRAGWRMHGEPYEVSPSGPLMYPMMREPRRPY